MIFFIKKQKPYFTAFQKFFKIFIKIFKIYFIHALLSFKEKSYITFHFF